MPEKVYAAIRLALEITSLKCLHFIENLQKEVKSRIQYIIDVLGKMEIALQQPVIPDKSRTRSPSPKETRRVRKASTDR